MKNKSDVFDILKIFHIIVKRKSWNLKYLRSDTSGEYYSNEFVEYYSKYEIIHEKTIPHTS